MSNPIKFDTILHKFFDTFDSFVNFDQKKKNKIRANSGYNEFVYYVQLCLNFWMNLYFYKKEWSNTSKITNILHYVRFRLRFSTKFISTRK